MSLTNFNVNGIDLSYVFQRLTFNISGFNSSGTTTSNGYNYNYYMITSDTIINVTNGFGKRFYYLAVGGGGGGGGSSISRGGYGGNAGKFRFGPLNTLINNTISCDLASGGLGTSSDGGFGGTTIIGFTDKTYNADIYITGGNGGLAAVTGNDGSGGSGTDIYENVVLGSAASGNQGGAGGNGINGTPIYGYSLFACGGGGGGSSSVTFEASGGQGGGGKGGKNNSNGMNATNFGSGGGGGGSNSKPGGNGSPGLIIFFVQQ
jgi:hypothetical protein